MGTDGWPNCGDGFSGLPETGEGKAVPAPEEVGVRSSSSSRRSASSRVLSMLWSSGWAMNQVRILSVKTGLVALIPSSSIVRPDCFVRSIRAERLYLEALTAKNALGQEYNQKNIACAKPMDILNFLPQLNPQISSYQLFILNQGTVLVPTVSWAFQGREQSGVLCTA
jgi:hypothetical protein